MTNDTNLLKKETSPYLLQHKDNPVNWWPWCDAALQQAESENKPVLLSVGYAACHWCHVMAHESFEDKEIATLMNDKFINIKVDREERPDIDAIYQKALQTMGEAGGWPLTMILTPDGKPFFGGTYFPKTASHGRPPFALVLEKISDAFHNKPELVLGNADKIIEHLKQTNIPSRVQGRPLNISISDVAESVWQIMDGEHGGTSGAPKFPQTAMLQTMWWGYIKTSEEKFKDAIFLALKRMSLGGIYDHIGGGYSRYSTDKFWFAPHFEKMLYDNAYILEMLSLAYLSSGDIFWRRRASETIGWLLREMQISDGANIAFASAIDADSEGREGAFYVWQEGDIKNTLGKNADLFTKTFGVKKQGNWSEGEAGENILHLLHLKHGLNDAEEGKLKSLKKLMLAEREKRQRPLTDHKILCDWNGMMINALAVCSRTFNEPKWLEQAKSCYEYIKVNLCDNNYHLVHSYCDEKRGATGLLEDYSHMARAAITLYEETGEDSYIDDAQAWLSHILTHFKNQQGGYYQKADYDDNLIIKTCEAQDGATPSGNAVLLEVLAKTYHLTNDNKYKEAGDELYSSFSGEVTKHPLSYVSLIQAKAVLDSGLLITVEGDRNNKTTHEFLEVIHANARPNKVVKFINSFDKPASVILCESGRCSIPINTIKELEKQLVSFQTL